MTSISIHREGEIAFLSMEGGTRPAMVDTEFCSSMQNALEEIQQSKTDRVVVLRGSGKMFSAGGDLHQIEKFLVQPDRMLGDLIDQFHDVILRMRRFPLPIIASVHGPAAGAGFSVAMACDFVVAADSACFMAGYPKIGTSSDGGLSFHLSQRLGAQRALEIFLLRDRIDAGEAKALGIVNVVTQPETLHLATVEVAHQLLGHSPQSVKELKALTHFASEGQLQHCLDLEREAFLRCAATPEFRSRVGAFTAKMRSI